MKSNKLFLLIFYIFISVNHPIFAKDVSKPTTDFTTPESALKSYWTIKEWLDIARNRLVKKNDDELYKLERDSLISVTTGDIKQYFESFKKSSDEVYERTIIEVKIENSELAIIRSLIKNITPIPKDAIPTPRQIEIRKNGREVVYKLKKEFGEWKVSEIRKAPNEFWPEGVEMYKSSPPLYPYEVYFD